MEGGLWRRRGFGGWVGGFMLTSCIRSPSREPPTAIRFPARASERRWINRIQAEHGMDAGDWQTMGHECMHLQICIFMFVSVCLYLSICIYLFIYIYLIYVYLYIHDDYRKFIYLLIISMFIYLSINISVCLCSLLTKGLRIQGSFTLTERASERKEFV